MSIKDVARKIFTANMMGTLDREIGVQYPCVRLIQYLTLLYCPQSLK